MRARLGVMALVTTIAATAGALATASLAAAPWIVADEVNWDRPGGDYATATVGDDPAACRALCTQDDRCAAYSFVRRTPQGTPARCFLKRTVPPRAYNPCCTSGVKFDPDTAYDIEEGIDRPGGDVQSWKVGSVVDCRNLCQQASTWCVAYTHVRNSGMCYLKNTYRGKQRDPYSASGVVRPYAVPAYY